MALPLLQLRKLFRRWDVVVETTYNAGYLPRRQSLLAEHVARRHNSAPRLPGDT